MIANLVFYHANCADGFGAAYAAWSRLGSTDTAYYPMHYGDKIEAVVTSEQIVYILDFSFPLDTMLSLCDVARKVVWLDHHKTARDIEAALRERPMVMRHHINIDMNKSGTILAWEYFTCSSSPPEWMQKIDDHDRWKFALDGTREFNKGLWSHAPWSFQQWNQFFNGFSAEANYAQLHTDGAAILRAHRQNVATAAKHARPCKLGEHTGLAINASVPLTSDLGHELAAMSNTYGLVWYVDKTGLCRCSLRSNGNYDVSTIAKQFGGGGHKNAAGFSATLGQIVTWTQNE